MELIITLLIITVVLGLLGACAAVLMVARNRGSLKSGHPDKITELEKQLRVGSHYDPNYYWNDKTVKGLDNKPWKQ